MPGIGGLAASFEVLPGIHLPPQLHPSHQLQKLPLLMRMSCVDDAEMWRRFYNDSNYEKLQITASVEMHSSEPDARKLTRPIAAENYYFKMICTYKYKRDLYINCIRIQISTMQMQNQNALVFGYTDLPENIDI